MEMLKNVYYKLEENHQAGLSELFEELEAEGICRIVAGERNKSWQNREAVSGSHGDTVISDALLITDDCRLAEQAETEGIACLGISDSDGYFAGAAMVLPDLLDVDVQMLRECYCHFHGIPATIAEDGRLILRELAEEDVDMLCRIGEEDGMEYAFCGSQRKAGFTPEVLKAYCKEQYRLYGYGLWGVFLKEAACSGEADGKERLIGCCGFAEASEHESGHGLQLELEYMLSRRTGIAALGMRCAAWRCSMPVSICAWIRSGCRCMRKMWRDMRWRASWDFIRQMTGENVNTTELVCLV